MLVLGVTAKDKGSQLEALVHAELTSQGYVNVISNFVGSGGNELDVVAVREIGILGAPHQLPLMCEGKAYADPVNMPTWQKFLGKLFLARIEKPDTIGILLALNGVNGNVQGSFSTLRQREERVFIFDGTHLVEQAREAGEIATAAEVEVAVQSQFHRQPDRLDIAYYGGYFWVVRWNTDEYSVVDSHGTMLPAQTVEGLRAALEGSVSGTLLAVAEEQARSDADHERKVGLIYRLFEEGTIQLDNSCPGETAGAVAAVSAEPYAMRDHGRLSLRPPSELSSSDVGRLFASLFERPFPVRHLRVMESRSHAAYVDRLIEVMPEIHAGFEVDDNDLTMLRRVAALFPSFWVTLARPIEMITTHRTGNNPVEASTLAADRNTFWDEIIKGVRIDFTNVFLRGFLYDYLGVAELQETVTLGVKSKTDVVGTMKTETRTAVRQLSEEFVTELGARHALIRMLPAVSEPWEDEHPEPLALPGS